MMNWIQMNNIYPMENSKNHGVKKELDKEAFLELLVTQLKNQDPLEPLKDREFIAQMTQLSTLEQITNMSESVQKFVESSASLYRAQVSSMVGKYAVVKSNIIELKNGVTNTQVFKLEEPSHVILKIYDENGKIVKEEDLGNLEAGMQTFLWDGRNNDGVALPDGIYNFGLYTVQPDGSLSEISAMDGGKVEAVQFKDNDVYVLVNGNLYPINSIIEISEEG
ncbi:flagellar hook capping protein FlgD [Thermosipho affectus]|uniref:Basal-body rod modification protein FlgD n=2 Tax=Thermosipho TaxID=2420 RepID=A0ABX3IJF4_9BACT|nr:MULTISPECIES: flagellar hook assembly protein FlgD [Thermosipho]ANQ54206.1 flagellar hook capping protein FlgD [Thermosipho sp. 1070]APT72651.1 flagellar hook capping protein FlgD [Thermosipho sp. 1063]ONN26652.1 flagellar hook capping protein FlgD [Thermosipho affectus]OOC42048.1 flagellar hook capping protein FlgD [Thermosipho sp. 1074]